MILDLANLKSLLQVNGLTTDSPIDQIRDLLSRAGYSATDTDMALAVLHGQPTTPPASAVPTPTGVPTSASIASGVTPIAPIPTSSSSVPKPSLFQGRMGVGQYWLSSVMLFLIVIAEMMFSVVIIAPLFAVAGTISVLSAFHSSAFPSTLILVFVVAGILVGIVGVIVTIYFLGLQVRRLHDIGLTGWVILIWAVLQMLIRAPFQPNSSAALGVSVAILIATIVLYSWPGSTGENKYGSPAKYASVWGAFCGSLEPTGNFKRFFLKFLLPILAVELVGILMAAGFYFLAPHSSGSATGKLGTSTFFPSVLMSAPVPPSIIVPTGWVKLSDIESQYLDMITYVSPSTAPGGVIQIAVNPTKNQPLESALTIDKSLPNTENFSERSVTVSGFPAIEDEYDTNTTIDTIKRSNHSENLYFTAKGYDYSIRASYAASEGSQSATEIQAALDSVTLSS